MKSGKLWGYNFYLYTPGGKFGGMVAQWKNGHIRFCTSTLDTDCTPLTIGVDINRSQAAAIMRDARKQGFKITKREIRF